MHERSRQFARAVSAMARSAPAPEGYTREFIKFTAILPALENPGGSMSWSPPQ
jgi:hypothetical protein